MKIRRTEHYRPKSIWLLLALLLCSCGGESVARGDSPPVVLTTFTVIADMAAEVAGAHIRVESITKAGTEIHGYEPTPGDIARASQADLIIDNGLGLEAWFEKFIDRVDVPRVVASEGVAVVPIASEAYAGRANPHAWMSALNAEIYVDNIAAAFAELDPAHAGDFERNAEAYKTEIRAVHDDLVERLGMLPDLHRVLVTCEGAFSYLARDVGLTEVYIWPVNAEQQATPQQVAGAISLVVERQVPAVFCESTVSDEAMQQVVRETGASFGGVLYVDSLSGSDGPVPTYLDLLKHDSRVIADGLIGTGS
jgi:manganese transport system substrate-binding protein